MFKLQDMIVGNEKELIIHGSSEIDPQLTFLSAQHDSRKCEQHDLFVAIAGAHVDGHKFIPELARAGVAAALCTTLQQDVPENFLQLVVPDVTKALQKTARIRVQRQPQTLKIGITGSSGKTTTKEAIAAVLSRQAPTLKTHASYNNELGYPLTLLRLEPEHRYAVLEMGAERVGELRELCETIARPDWTVITIVGNAHINHFGSIENIAIAKSELVEALPPEGIAFLNYDDPAVRAMSSKTQARVIYYGRHEEATVRSLNIEEKGLLGSSFTLHVDDQDIQINLHLPGQHGITTALAAAAVGYAAQIPLETIRSALEELTPVQGRGQVKIGAGPNGSTLIDDTYNAARQSIVAMVQALGATKVSPQGKRWAVLGEILDQGSHAYDEHSVTGKGLAGHVDYLVTIGDFARYYGEAAIEATMDAQHIYHFPVDFSKAGDLETGKQAVVDFLKQKVTPDDLILVKGSHDMNMGSMFSQF